MWGTIKPQDIILSTVAIRQKHFLGWMVYLMKMQANCMWCDITGNSIMMQCF